MHPLRVKVAREDANTFTPEGLALALHKVYTPDQIPIEVQTALSSEYEISSLGQEAEIIKPKDRHYLRHYIDNLLQQTRDLTNNMHEPVNEHLETRQQIIEKQQSHISHLEHTIQLQQDTLGDQTADLQFTRRDVLSQADRIHKAESLLRYTMPSLADDKREEALLFATTRLHYDMTDLLTPSSGTSALCDDAMRIRRNVHLVIPELRDAVKYWKQRALDAEHRNRVWDSDLSDSPVERA
jgi:hypothetical protein